jgi:hypothetical protein
MAYISEYISDEDKANIGFARLTAHNWKIRPDSAHRWVIDRETGNWLLSDNWGGEDDPTWTSFVFFWNGYPINFTATINELEHDGKYQYGWQLISEPNLVVPVDQVAAFYVELQVAFNAYQRFLNPAASVAVFKFSPGK